MMETYEVIGAVIAIALVVWLIKMIFFPYDNGGNRPGGGTSGERSPQSHIE